MSVYNFKTGLITLPLAHREEHGSFIQSFLTDFDQSLDHYGLWMKLSTYWSFLNYALLDNLIEHLEENCDLRGKMDTYLKSLQQFQMNTSLSDFAKWYLALRKKATNTTSKNFVVHCDLDWETCTLEDLNKLHVHILHKFHLPSFSMTLEEVKNGCLIITWSIPSELVSHVREQLKNPDIMTFYKEQRILSISIDGKEFSYSASLDRNG